MTDIVEWLLLAGTGEGLHHKAAAEITQLRADLEQERELADRLYSAIEYIDDYCLAYPELEAVSAVSSSAIDYVDTRRNK